MIQFESGPGARGVVARPGRTEVAARPGGRIAELERAGGWREDAGDGGSRAECAGTREALRTTRAVLEVMFGAVGAREFAVRFWTGDEDVPAGVAPRFTLVLRDPGSLRRMLRPPVELHLAEAYLRDDIDIEGDVEAAAALADPVRARLGSPRAMVALIRAIRALPDPRGGLDAAVAERHPRTRGARWVRRHSAQRDAVAVRAHYNAGNEFYALWLDPLMVYSCAYFAPGVETLAGAQLAKLDLICRKLRLRPGQRLLDVGCGWGGLIVYAAERYGVEAVGITLSERQAELARERIAAAGLARRARVEVLDYRSLPGDERFDRVVSVGMVEHVGLARLSEYFERLYELTAPGGLFMNHGIVAAPVARRSWAHRQIARRVWGEGEFIDRYVFPDGELVPLGAMVGAAERAGFQTVDVESLRPHYARTLRHWVSRLEGGHDEAAALVGEPTYRVWRLYMAASAHGFASGRLNLAQVLLARRRADGTIDAPPTREDIYLSHSRVAGGGGAGVQRAQ